MDQLLLWSKKARHILVSYRSLLRLFLVIVCLNQLLLLSCGQQRLPAACLDSTQHLAAQTW